MGGVQILFEVADHGIGLSPSQAAHLFQAFHQADASSAQQFGGGVWGESRPADLVGDAASVDSRVGTLSGRTVMVVDDNELNLRVACELLEAAGAEVFTESHGREALESLARHAMDVVLMNFQMPVMDGIEATRRIGAHPLWRALPVIAMTANARREDALAWRKAGMNAFVTKPVVPSQFYATVSQWATRQATLAVVETLATAPTRVAPDMAGIPTLIDTVAAPLDGPWDSLQAPSDPAPAVPVVQATEDPLDLSVLSQLTRRNPKLMREIASVFLVFMDRTMAELDAALLAGDRGKLSALGHKSKSSAGAVGANRLSDLCQQLELSMKLPSTDLDQARHLVSQIRAQMGPIAEKLATLQA
jgi:CheY-like chemotaxis protein/HPt (histidine-containing phosphotransfer) domain-containing protein